MAETKTLMLNIYLLDFSDRFRVKIYTSKTIRKVKKIKSFKKQKGIIFHRYHDFGTCWLESEIDFHNIYYAGNQGVP